MARSMAVVTAANAPPAGSYFHKLSGRQYEVHKQANKLWHRSSFHDDIDPSPDDKLVDMPIDYVIGSGAQFQIYLAEIDGFLVESPLTWYVSKPGWEMSPGYDEPFPPAFERAIPEKCLFCHTGRTEAVGNSLHRVRFHELKIGCERCHGPGSLHVQRMSSASDDVDTNAAEQDDTIVNPAKLSRHLAEDVCHQCHLTTKAYVEPRGRKLSEYRPGRRLRDFRVYYQLHSPKDPMRVVSHVEQQLLSRCYQESDSLSCLTCHSLHHTPRPEERLEYYRAICLKCHQPESCQVEHATLARVSPENDCVECHMPRVSTKTLHVAVTHHRIGIHPDEDSHVENSLSDAQQSELVPLDDLSHLSDVDRTRLMGLAYLDLILHLGMSPDTQRFSQRAQDLLLQTREMGLREGNVDANLAHLLWSTNQAAANHYAAAALQSPSLSPQSRINALFAVASYRKLAGQREQAIRFATELTQIRRHPADWWLIGDCHLALGNGERAIRAYETAVAINPNLIPIHENLCRLHEEQGNATQVAKHRHLLERLEATAERLRKGQ
ncbi:MAG: hypothetical protein CMJ64_16675 [Planctomycetaceae bacterium]|nr:hypothetical protein [Planctomycetaceae bacterium]